MTRDHPSLEGIDDTDNSLVVSMLSMTNLQNRIRSDISLSQDKVIYCNSLYDTSSTVSNVADTTSSTASNVADITVELYQGSNLDRLYQSSECNPLYYSNNDTSSTVSNVADTTSSTASDRLYQSSGCNSLLSLIHI